MFIPLVVVAAAAAVAADIIGSVESDLDGGFFCISGSITFVVCS